MDYETVKEMNDNNKECQLNCINNFYKPVYKNHYKNQNEDILYSRLQNLYKDTEDFKRRTTYRFEVNHLGFLTLVNKYDGNTIVIKGVNELYDYLNRKTYFIIENLSELKKHKHVLNTYNITVNTSQEIKDSVNIFLGDLDTLYIKRVNNIKEFVGKCVLRGDTILKSYDKTLYYIKRNNNIYLVSDCNLLIQAPANFKLNNMFCKKLVIDNLDITLMYSLKDFLKDCYTIESVEIKNFNFENIISLDGFFCNCYRLKNINIDFKNTSKLITMSYMFYKCDSLKSLDLRNFNVDNVEDFSNLFNSCMHLEYLDISTWNISSNYSTLTGMFTNCDYLKKVRVNSKVASLFKKKQVLKDNSIMEII